MNAWEMPFSPNTNYISNLLEIHRPPNDLNLWGPMHWINPEIPQGKSTPFKSLIDTIGTEAP